MNKVGFKYGLYGLVFSLILFLGMLYFGMGLDYDTQEVLGYLTILVSLSFVYFGIRHYRDQVNDGKLTFGKGFLVGLMITLFTAIGIAIADFIYTTAIYPEFFDDYAKMMREQGFAGEIPDYGSGFMAFIMYMTVVLIGLVVSLVAALLLKRR
jgi:hypothetical protein